MGLSSIPARLLTRHGRAMTLRRRTGTSESFTEVTIYGFAVSYSAQDIAGHIQQGDARVTLAPNAGALTAPRDGDFLVIDGAHWAFVGPPEAVYVGSDLSAWRAHIRGGGL
jgi:hypothetical protein